MRGGSPRKSGAPPRRPLRPPWPRRDRGGTSPSTAGPAPTPGSRSVRPRADPSPSCSPPRACSASAWSSGRWGRGPGLPVSFCSPSRRTSCSYPAAPFRRARGRGSCSGRRRRGWSSRRVVAGPRPTPYAGLGFGRTGRFADRRGGRRARTGIRLVGVGLRSRGRRHPRHPPVRRGARPPRGADPGDPPARRLRAAQGRGRPRASARVGGLRPVRDAPGRGRRRPGRESDERIRAHRRGGRPRRMAVPDGRGLGDPRLGRRPGPSRPDRRRGRGRDRDGRRAGDASAPRRAGGRRRRVVGGPGGRHADQSGPDRGGGGDDVAVLGGRGVAMARAGRVVGPRPRSRAARAFPEVRGRAGGGRGVQRAGPLGRPAVGRSGPAPHEPDGGPGRRAPARDRAGRSGPASRTAAG